MGCISSPKSGSSPAKHWLVKSYYLHAADKRAAVRDIIQVQDARAFLARSGWHPGIVLQ
jgi:hypothetical protein